MLIHWCGAFWESVSKITKYGHILAFFLLSISLSVAGETTRLNGFIIDDPLVPIDQIMRGGPPRDGIPSIDEPQFTTVNRATFLKDEDRVLGVNLNGEQKAYPIRILNYHEIVNDYFGGKPVLISFCPLCGTGMVFDSKFEGQSAKFGVSGLLYNSDLLMYDRNTESLWSQIEGKAISGALKGQHLELLPVEHTTWKAWKSHFPNTKVLSTDTGYLRNYGRTPYPGYQSSEYIYFPISNMDRRYHSKEWVLGLDINNQKKAYPFAELRASKGIVEDTVGGESVFIHFDDEHNSVKVLSEAGEQIAAVTSFWFAWMTFHPKSEVYSAASHGLK